MSWRKGQIPNRKGWARVRRKVFERDGYRCRSCGRAGRLECDHVQRLDTTHKDPLDMSNLQALCRGCHIAKTAQENRTPHQERDDWTKYLAGIMEGIA